MYYDYSSLHPYWRRNVSLHSIRRVAFQSRLIKSVTHPYYIKVCDGRFSVKYENVFEHPQWRETISI